MKDSPLTYTIDTEPEVREALEARFRIRREPLPSSTRTYYDTFDWRIYRHGSTLSVVTVGGASALSWEAGNGRPLFYLEGASPPAFVWDLADGPLREALAPVIEMRRLLPVVQAEVHNELLRILDRQDKTVVRVVLEERTACPPGNSHGRSPMAAILRVAPVKGYDVALRDLLNFIETELDLRPRREPELDLALASIGRRAGDYSSKIDVTFGPQGRADEAVREILELLLQTLLRNEEGIRQDIDSEFLHDFRVASRRARSALGQVKEVFPRGRVDELRGELSWLGQATGPTRDLDVYLLKMPGYRADLPESVAADLEPLGAFLREHRGQEHGRLIAVLDSERYRQLIRLWQAFVDRPLPTESNLANAQRPVMTVASEHIWRAYRRVWKRGRAIEADTPAEALHRLRIDCKKLRYLMEFFRCLYDSEEIGRLIKALKQLQDNLGDFNDLEVQQESLKRMAEQMVEEKLAPVATLMAMGRLVEHLELRQVEERRRFSKCFARFSTADNRARFRHLFKEEGRAVA